MAQARLNATITDDGGLSCEGRFQYGLTPAMGLFTPWQGGTLVTGDSFSHVLTGLLGGTIYFFQAEVRNAVGTGTSGAILSFMTSLSLGSILNPIVDILAPTLVTEHQATLNGMVTFQGDRLGQVRFQWGASASYGMTTAWQSGFGTGNSFSAAISGLSPGQAYHCRAEFQNSHGPPVVSGDLTFSTLSEVGGMVLVGDDILTILGR
ncbi:MAG: hypothetical protein Q8O55_01460 [Dehalococcoidales bacterium]|nr:hypothetical protein [Dehalococcoidales bacterium]